VNVFVDSHHSDIDRRYIGLHVARKTGVICIDLSSIGSRPKSPGGFAQSWDEAWFIAPKRLSKILRRRRGAAHWKFKADTSSFRERLPTYRKARESVTCLLITE
jgi:hypothetical protein